MMVSKHWGRKLFWTALLGSLLAVPSVLLSQPGGPGGRGGFRGRHGMKMLRDLDLSDEQRDQVRTLMERARSTGVHERVMAAAKALEDAIENPESDESTIRELAYQKSVAEEEAAVERWQLTKEFRQILTEEQLQKLAQLKREREEEMEERRKRFEERRKNRQNGNPD